MSSKKIILITPFFGVIGGIQKWANNIYSYYLSDGKGDVELIPFDFSRIRSGQMAKNKVSRICTFLTDYIKLTKSASNFIRNTEANVVHITTPAGVLLLKDIHLIRQAHKCGKNTIVHFHFGRIPELFKNGGWELRLLKKVMASADKVIVMDKKSYDTLQLNGYSNIENVPNPISHETMEIIVRCSTKKIPRTILFAGHVVPTKGVEELVLACRNIPDIRLTVLGAVTPDYKQHLLSIAGDDCDRWLKINGEADYETTIAGMCESSVFALPSYTEGFPNVILESMACGCSIVSTNVGAIPQMLDVDNKGKECGIVVPPKDISLLQSSLERMLTDTDFTERCKVNAMAKVAQSYCVEAVWSDLMNVWLN